MFAFIFDSVGAGEWVVLLAVLLIVMGPKRLPSTLRTFGSYYTKFRSAAESLNRQLWEMDSEIQREVSKFEREVEEAAPPAEREVAEATKPVDETPTASTTGAATASAETKVSDDGHQAS